MQRFTKNLLTSDTEGFDFAERNNEYSEWIYTKHSNSSSISSKDFSQSQHPYFTRSIAKRLASANYVHQPLVNAITTITQPQASRSSLTLTDSSQISLLRHSIETTTISDSSRNLWNANLSLHGNHSLTNNRENDPLVVFQGQNQLNHSGMDSFNVNTPADLRWRAFQFVLVAVALALCGWYVHVHFLETHIFFDKVEVDLSKIKLQMEQIEFNVEKDAQQLKISIEKSTTEKLKSIEKLLVEIKQSQEEDLPSTESQEINKTENETIHNLVMRYLDEYNSQKTGKTDFALESAGGSIVEVNAEPYNLGSTRSSLFGLPLCGESNGPRTVIQANVLPGECWAFKGSSGSLVIQLLGRIFISGVSLEHIAKSISPSGEIDSAPKDFSIWALTHEYDNKRHFFGKFTYDINGPPLQYFVTNNISSPYQFIEFKVHSNHGNPLYTCVYRLRVHGALGKTTSNKA